MPARRQNELIVAGILAAAAAVLARPLWKKLRVARAPLHKLKGHGVEVHISALGGIIQRLLVVDGHGETQDIVLGHDRIGTYLSSGQYFGAVVGRVCNRIAGASFVLEGKEYQLAANDGSNHLHGGNQGWDKAIWNGRSFKHKDGDAVELTYTSKDGEEGYPGTVQASITYILQPSGSLKTVFEATTDKTTPINMTQHSYFNLGGHDSGDILNHKLQIVASNYTPKGANNTPSGDIEPVDNTPFDFTESRRVGNRIEEVPGGYDHNFVLFGLGKQAKFATTAGSASQQPKFAAQLEDPKTGRVLKILTTAPGMQFYAGNFIDGVKGKGGTIYGKNAGLCLETQGFPNAVNEPSFPSVLLTPGETYHHEVIYQFSTK